MTLTFTSCISCVQVVSSFSSDFQLRTIEESLRLTPTPRRSIIGVVGSPAAASDSAFSSDVAASRDNVDRGSDGRASDDDDVVAIAAIANAAADARSSSSEHSDDLSDDTMGGTPHLSPSDTASASSPSTFPDGDDVQQMLLQVQPLFVLSKQTGLPFLSPLNFLSPGQRRCSLFAPVISRSHIACLPCVHDS